MSKAPALQRAHEAFEDKKYDVAETLCLDVLKDDPKAYKALQLLAYIAQARNDWEQAELKLEAALEIAPHDAECLNSLGNILSLTGRVFKAVEMYEESLKQAPNYLNPAVALGSLHLRMKDPIEAVTVFEAALTHNPQNKNLITGLIHGLKDAQQYDEVAALLKKLPPDPSLALIAGEVAAVNKQAPIARGAFVSALSHPPSSFPAFRNLVELEWQAGGVEAAQKFINDLIEKSPETGLFYLGGADLLGEMGEADEGIDLLEMAEKKFGELPDIQAVRAKLWIELGEGNAARAQAEAALKGRPGDPAAMSHYARAMLMLGEFDEALKAIKAGQMRQPKNQYWIGLEAMALRGLGQMDAYHALYNYDLVQVTDLEAPPEYKNMTVFLSKLKSDLDALHAQEAPSFGVPVHAGTQIHGDLRFTESRAVQDFFQTAIAPIKAYLSALPEAMPDFEATSASHPFSRRQRKSRRFGVASSVHLSGGGYHKSHLRPEGWLSCRFHVDVPKGIKRAKGKAGWTEFGRPSFDIPGFDADHVIMPTAGQLVLCPSYMWQATRPLTAKGSSLTLSFDIHPA